jgi:hypothetical protein
MVMDQVFAKLTVELLKQFNAKLVARTATVKDLHEVIANGKMFVEYAHSTGVWQELDERYRSGEMAGHIRNFQPTQENIAAHQNKMASVGVAVSYNEAARHISRLQDIRPQHVEELLASGGTHAGMVSMLTHLETMETNWRLNPTKLPQSLCCGKFQAVNRMREDPCAFMHLVAASFTVISFFGCLPCLFAGGVAELFGQLCDNFL